MLQNEINMTYQEFLDKYVINPYIDYCISFRFRNKIYQFDYTTTTPTNVSGLTPYDFIIYDTEWNEESRLRFKNLLEAIKSIKIDGLDFKDIYNSKESKLIDIS